MTEHTDELKRAIVAIRDLRRQVQRLETSAREPIAIIGAACRLPGGANTPEAFWELLRDGVDATSEVPPERWNNEEFYDPDPDAPGKVYTRRGGYLSDPVDRFDAGFFGISPREASSMDPVQRLLLELSWESLERAGIPPLSLGGSSTGVFVGVSGSDYLSLQHRTESLEEIDSYRGTGSAACVTGGRISYVLGLQGPNVSIDTACSSSLTAISMAVESLRAGTSDMALAGGAHLMLSPETTVYLCRMRALSPSGICRTFDAAADGYGRGEGGVVFVLKRLSRAQADGDPILAVIRGVAVNHDGRSSGLTVPNAVAQRAVVQAALENAGLEPTDVDYLEAHGTATPLGDPIEVRGMADVLGRGRTAENPLLIGSVKTNFGHLEAASGAAGLLKLVLSLQKGELPPHLHFNEPSPHIDWERLPIQVNRELRPFTGSGRGPIAGVNAFGFSGTNAHVIVEKAPESPVDTPAAHPAELILVSGRTPEAVREEADRYSAILASPDAPALGDLALTSIVGRTHFEHRASVTAASTEEMRLALTTISPESAGNGPGRIAFLFTGQGSQYPGMARELVAASPTARAVLERCDEILRPHLDRPLLELLIDEEDTEVLRQTGYAQPAIFAIEYALAALWRSWGVEPSFVAGHSLGEYVAAVVAGIMSLEEALPLVALRGRLMQSLPAGGAMAAVLAPEDTVRAAIDSTTVSVAACNGPENVVVSGDEDEIRTVLAGLAERGIDGKWLQVSHAFHSYRMDPILDEFEAAVRELHLVPPTIPLISNLTGQPLTDAEAVDPARWRRHIREPVRFADSVAELRRRGVETFLEVGPHPSLLAMGQATVTDAGVRWLPSMRRGRSAWLQILETLGALWRAGLEIDPEAFANDHGGRRVIAPTYPFQREPYWFTDGGLSAATLRPAARSERGLHPLLGKLIRSPVIEGWVFETELSPNDPAFLADHRVGGQVLVPAAGFVEMFLQAAKHGPGWTGGVELRELTLERPLIVAEGAIASTQVILDPARDGDVRARLASYVAAENRWETIARCVLSAGPARDEDAASGPASAPTGAEVSIEELYDDLAARGIEYGPAFRTLVEAHRDGGQATGTVALRAGEATDGFALHPALLDGAFHLLASLSDSDGDRSATFLPSGIDQLRLYRAASRCRVHISAASADDGPDQFSADLSLLDEEGRLVAELSGFRARRVRSPVVDADHYQLDWEELELPTPAAPAGGDWLVAGGDNTTTNLVIDALERAGAASVRAAATTEEAVVLSGDSPPDAMVMIDPGMANADRSDVSYDTARQGFAGLLDLLASGVTRSARRLAIITRSAAGPEAPRGGGWLSGAGLWGAHSALRSEYPSLAPVVVDLPDAEVDPVLVGLALTAAVSAEDRIAVRAGRLLAPRLRRANDPEASPTRTPAVVDGENYWMVPEPRGTLDAISYRPRERVEPGPGEVEVRIRLTGLNFRDVLNVLGGYDVEFGDPGLEFAGVVTRVGPGVDHLAVGDEVMGLGSGLYAAFATVPANGVVRVPGNIAPEEAATIPMPFLSAEWGLRHAGELKAGERVLIHAATGGVGQAAVQIARAIGAEVFATAGSETKREWLRAQGVQHVFDSRSTSFADGVLAATGGEGVDVVLNSLTGDLLRRGLDLLRPGGRFVELGLAELLDEADLGRMHPGVRYTAFQLGRLPISDDEFRAMFTDIADRVERGELRPLPVRVYGPDRITDAFRFVAQARHIGKVAIGAARLQAPAIRPDGSYVVVGGGGGIGRALTAWLVEQGAGAVVVNGRSAADESTERWLNELRDRGSVVTWFAGDVTDIEKTRGLIEHAAATGFTVRGVFHAAGILDDGLLDGYDMARFDRVADPKVRGAINLHDATRDRELDHFVLFSSTASLLAGPGQAAYGAANSALGAITRWRTDRGLPALAIDWGGWAGDGMIARLSDRERELLRARGLEAMTSSDALAGLDTAMRSGVDRRMIARIQWARLREATQASPVPLLGDLLGATDDHRAGDRAPDVTTIRFDPAEWAILSSEERGERLGEYLVSSLAAVLRLRPDRVGMNASIAHLGFDSLMAMELRNRIETDLGVLVPVAGMLASATPAELALRVQGLLEEESPAAAAAPEPAASIETFEF